MLAVLLIAGTCYAQGAKNNASIKNKEVNMSVVQQNKAVIVKLYDQYLNQRNAAILQEIISPDYTGAQGHKGPAAFAEPVAPLLKAFPDAQWKLEELIAEGDKVIVKQQLHGTHTGQFQHIAATGKQVTNNGISIYEFKDGKIINSLVQTDRLGFLQQLGVLPFDLTLLPQQWVDHKQ